MKKIDDIFNPNTPTDLTKIKDYPKAVRDKAVEIYNLIKEIERVKTTSSISDSLNIIPTLQALFLKGSPLIPSGYYLRNQDEWYGHSNYEFLPPTSQNPKEGERVFYDNKVYQLYFDGDNKVWSEKNDFYPKIFFDFFRIKESTNGVLENYGNNLSINLDYRNITHLPSDILPYIKTSKTSNLRTLSAYQIKKSFTLTSTFFNISRTYEANQEVVNQSHIAIIFFIKDEFENVKFGIGINKDNRLVITNFSEITPTDFIVMPNTTFQLSIKLLDGKVSVLVDGIIVYNIMLVTLNDKQLYFSFGDDYGYGTFANCQLTIGEIQIFEECLTHQEILWNKENPRTWCFKKPNHYLELTLDEKIKLKEFLKTI